MDSHDARPHTTLSGLVALGGDDLFDGLCDGIALVDREGTIADCSGSLAILLGSSRSALRGTSLFPCFAHPPAATLRQTQARVLESGVPQRVELAVHDASGQATAVWAVLRPVAAVGQRLVAWSLVLDPRPSAPERGSAMPTTGSPVPAPVGARTVGFWEADFRADRVQWSTGWVDRGALPLRLDEAGREAWLASIHPEDRPSAAGYLELASGAAADFGAEFRVRTADGHWRWVMGRGRVMARDARGAPTRAAGVMMDIDDRQQTTLALRESEARLDTAIWGTGIGLWVGEADGSFLFLNDWCERFHVDPCYGPNQKDRWRATFHPDDVAGFSRWNDDLCSGAVDQYDIEYRVRSTAGEWVWIQERGKVVARTAEGAVARLAGICIEITDRKKVELALRDLKSRFDLAVDVAQLPVWEYDVINDVLKGNVYWHRIVGRDYDEATAAHMTETGLSDVHPDDQATLRQVYSIGGTDPSGLYEAEFRILLPSGEYRWLFDRGRVVERAEDGTPRRIIGISIDIDARKRMELAMRASEARLDTAIGGSDIGLWDWHVDRDEMTWLSDWPQRHGLRFPGKQVRPSDWVAEFEPEDRVRLLADNTALVHGTVDRIETDYRLRVGAHAWRWVQVRSRVVDRDGNGQAVRVVGSCIDVDTRRRAEELFRTQAIILETMREGVALVDAAGNITLSNPAFERLFGCEAAALDGRTRATLMGRADALGSRQAIAPGQLFTPQAHSREVVFSRRDGRQFTAEVTSGLLNLATGQQRLVVLQDVSERRQLEREVLSIASHERHRLGADLHDGLGQELTGVSLTLRSLATRLNRGAVLGEHDLDEVITLVNQSIESTRAMAHGMSPVTLEEGGIAAALHTLAERSGVAYGIRVRARTSNTAHRPVEPTLAYHLYRIAQEAIANAVKHGACRTAIVDLRITAKVATLTIDDDGTGIGIGADHGKGDGMGLKIMTYRARLVGGTVSVAPRADGGTRVTCSCPLKATRAPRARRTAAGGAGRITEH